MEPFVCDLLPARVAFGSGSLDRLPEEVAALGIRKVLLVAGGSAAEAGERAASLLGDLFAARFDTVRQHVPEDLAAQAREAAAGAAAGGVVTVGGGSAIGLGKAVAVAAGIPLVAVPTTYSGSEMTPVYGMLREGRKVTSRDARALPRTVVYDPDLTLDLAPRVTAASGFNALAHCLEAVAGPGASPPSVLWAEEGMRTLPPALRALAAEPRDAEARARAMYGGFASGRALACAGAGLQHRLAHAVGGRFGLVHADAHAALLPHVAAHHEAEGNPSMARVAAALGDGAAPASSALHDLAREVGAPTSLAELGMPREGIGAAADEAAAGADAEVLAGLLLDAFDGLHPGASRSAAGAGRARDPHDPDRTTGGRQE